MPTAKYIRISIADEPLEFNSIDELDISISYKLEDPENFQQKKSSEAFDITVPATLNNDRIANTFHNLDVEDMSEDGSLRNNRHAAIESNGFEILVGKAFLQSAKHDSGPLEYTFNFYGNNADWLIDLKEATLFDFISNMQFTFSKANIIASWAFDGTNEDLPYVFAPVRYGQPMTDYVPSVGATPVPDSNMQPEYMRPALSKYWILFWGFKSLGYRIQSDFMDSEYFRRQVMPWTWGNFLESDGTRIDNLDFLAKSTETVFKRNTSTTEFWDVKASNDSTLGGFDNNGVYGYNNPVMTWTYLPTFNYGPLRARMRLAMSITATAFRGSDVELRVQWFVNGQRKIMPGADDNANGTKLVAFTGGNIVVDDVMGIFEDYFEYIVNPGDTISAKLYLHMFDSGTGRNSIYANVDAFELESLSIPLNGIIDFENYLAFKKYKFLDFLGGIVDEFNLSIQTDAVNKVVYIEPTHPYSTTSDLSATSGGYFNGNWVDWTDKQDLSKISTVTLFSESVRELLFRYKDDGNDGMLKTVQDRNVNKLAVGKYVFSDRFKAGKREIENRFFSAVMHYDVDQWNSLGTIGGESPQMITLIPENISNTSREAAQNTFEPKSAYYKGVTTDYGWIFDNVPQSSYPYMFAVNYKPGGENDPVLSYADEKIGPDTSFVVAPGLLRRFYFQRLAIMRNGQYYTTFLKLNNKDAADPLHREHKVINGQRYELVEINNYKPLKDESTECLLRKWAPVPKIILP